MKRTLLALAGAASLAVALTGAASAQSYSGYTPYGYAAPAYGYDYAAPGLYAAPRGEVYAEPQYGPGAAVYDPPYDSRDKPPLAYSYNYGSYAPAYGYYPGRVGVGFGW